MEGQLMRRCIGVRPGEIGMDVTSRCTLGDPNKLPEGVPQPARMPFVSDKHPRQTLEVINLLRKHRELCDVVLVVGAKKDLCTSSYPICLQSLLPSHVHW